MSLLLPTISDTALHQTLQKFLLEGQNQFDAQAPIEITVNVGPLRGLHFQACLSKLSEVVCRPLEKAGFAANLRFDVSDTENQKIILRASNAERLHGILTATMAALREPGQESARR